MMETNPQLKNLVPISQETFKTVNPAWEYLNCTPANGLKLKGNCKAYYDKYFTFDTWRQTSRFTCHDGQSQFGLMMHYPGKGALYLVDGVSKSLKLFGEYAGGDIPETVKAEVPLAFELVAGNQYVMEVIKTGWKHTFKLSDVTSEIVTTVIFDNQTQATSATYAGKGWGGPGLRSFTGQISCETHEFGIPWYPKTQAIMIGDSITEGTNMGANVAIDLRWCNQVREKFYQKDAMICGRGGDTTTGVLARLADLYSVGISSTDVIVLIGMNQRSEAGLAKWQTEIEEIYQLIVANHARPIICVPPIPERDEAFIFKMRDFILSKGWETIRFDLASSLNQDGVSYDASLYNDGVHPNGKGSQQLGEAALLELTALNLLRK